MKRIFKNLGLLTTIIAILGLSYSYYEARNLKVVNYVFSHQEIPQTFDGKKIVFISDIHCNVHFPPEKVKELVTRVNELKPDIIVLGGDNTEKNSSVLSLFFDAIRELKATYGVYSVLGNHDFWEDAELIQKGLKDCGFNICDNQSYWIHEGKDSLKIGGVGDLWEDQQLLENTIDDVDESDFCILLSHNPDYIEEIETNKVDLMLSGHTHGGQVTLLGLYAPVMPALWKPHLPQTGQKYRYGWKKKDNISLYVTSGVGMGNFPFRFFAPPEIVEIVLKKDKGT